MDGNANFKCEWDASGWVRAFYDERADRRQLRRNVWENTVSIVQNGGYTLPDGRQVILKRDREPGNYSKFYRHTFVPVFEALDKQPVITVVPDDCLDVAHRWVNEGLEVSVLNMASRRNPGGGVKGGAGAQEEYLFRCSDYYRFLYRYAPYAEEYGLKKSHYQYPLDRNYGGIFSLDVTVFRENERSGYALAPVPWKVNMIAVAGMNSPRLEYKSGEPRIIPPLVEGVKNKIRTVFRIACDQRQRNLVLGAMGCGAFHNPPKHVAELFREVLSEPEFSGAFRRICFAVKTDHNSHGGTNYTAFKDVLDGISL